MIIRPEFAGSIFGVEGRFHNLIGWDDSDTFMHQKFGTVARPIAGYGKGAKIRAELRFDDNPRNGHNTFAITGEVVSPDPAYRRDGGIVACGCLHEDIAKAFPELAPLIKWHLTSTDGPMHYVANTVYFAGDRDHSGRRAGEPSSFDEFVRFGDNPIHHKVKRKFLEFLRSAAEHNGRGRFDFEVIRVDHRDRGKPGAYQFGPKFTFGGYDAEWHSCPFDDEREALEFLEALQRCSPEFVRQPTQWSEGKVRELDKARDAAVWPDATDAELSVEPDQLRAALEARLPALLAEFRRDMESCGFIWSR